MQSEDFDNKLRQAADQHHPDYDEKAWSKMEKLLDRHLPQKKDDRRRFLFILLLFLFLGSGILVFINQPWKEKGNTVQTEQTIQKKVTTGTDEKTTVIEKEKKAVGETNDVNDTKNKKDKENNNSTYVAAQVTEVPDKDAVGTRAGKKELSVRTIIPSVANKKRNTKETEPDQLAIEPVSKPDSYRVNQDNFVTNDQQNKNLVEPSKPDILKLADDANVNMKKNEPGKNDNSTVIAPDQKNTDKQKETEKKKDVATKAKNKSKKTNSFFISLSAGPDVSVVETNELGKLNLLAGAGIGYTFKDKWTIRTGFYSGNKVYSAAPGYYKLPVPPQNPNYLYEIAADCKVYEIPLSLAYNFNPSKKHSLFASVGLSSFIMKKETYDYQYKYPNGTSWTYRHTEENKNRHYFSVLALSAGYEYKINKTFSIMTEPYFKVPMAGVGYGKVKLNSAGIAFSINIKPFQ
jgi:hypothetical protein